MKRIAAPLALLAGLVFLPPAGGRAGQPAPQRPSTATDAHPLLALAERCRKVEFFQMLGAVLGGSRMGPGEAWFHPGQSRYGWDWLRQRCDADGDGSVSHDEFPDSAEDFRRLDRDGSGAVTAADLDWSDNSPYWRQEQVARALLRRADRGGDGRVSAEEWAALFAEASRGGQGLDADALRQLLFPPARPGGPGDAPSPYVLVRGLFTGELGSPSEGPALNAPAPDFTLKTLKGDRVVTLGDYRGKKPVVLVFGSFT